MKRKEKEKKKRGTESTGIEGVSRIKRHENLKAFGSGSGKREDKVIKKDVIFMFVFFLLFLFYNF